MNNQTGKRLSRLKDRIWTTKKIRMEAEERRLQIKRDIDLVLNGVSALTLVLSVLSLVPSTLKNFISSTGLSILSIILSIIMIITSLVVTNYRLSEEAAQFRQSYTELDSLENVVGALSDENTKDLSELENKYTAILSKNLNHNNLDYIYFKYTQYVYQTKNKSDETKISITFTTKLIYWFTKFSLRILFVILVFTILTLVIISIIHA